MPLAGGNAGAGTRLAAAVPWNGKIHYSRTAMGHSSSADASENVSLEITYKDGAATGVGKLDFKRTESGCGTTLSHEAHGTATSPASVVLQTAGAGKYNVFVGIFGVTVAETKDEIVASCKAERRSGTSTWYIQVKPVLGVAGDPDKDAALSGSVSRDASQGCQRAVGEDGPIDTCQETLSWDLLRCDGGLIAKGFREFTLADEFSGRADIELAKSREHFHHWLKDEAKEFVSIAGEKLTALDILKTLGHDLGAAAEVTVFWVGIPLTEEWIRTDIVPAIKERDRGIKEAKADLDRSKAYAAKGKADLEAGLSPRCTDAAQRARDEEQRHDAAKALIESWEAEGSSLYWSPTTHELEDYGAALKEAERILSGTRKPQAVGAESTAARKVRVTRKQLEAAVKLYDRALRAGKQALAAQTHVETFTETFRKKLAATRR